MHWAKFGEIFEIGQWYWRRRFINFVNVFSLFRYYFPLENDEALHLNKIESPSPRMHCAKYGWNRPSGSWEEAFYISSMYFCYLIIISPWEKVWPFIGRNLNPLYPKPKIKIGLFDVVHRPNEKPAAGVFFLGGGRFVKNNFFFFFSDIFCFPSPVRVFCALDS